MKKLVKLRFQVIVQMQNYRSPKSKSVARFLKNQNKAQMNRTLPWVLYQIHGGEKPTQTNC